MAPSRARRAVVGAVLALGLARSGLAAASAEEYLQYAANAANVLNNEWYNSSTGLWQDLWWNSANMVTILADYSVTYPQSTPVTMSFIGSNGTFTRAATYNGGGFLNEYYDDEGWWALAWIKTYDLTGNSSYLDAAESIFVDLLTGNDATCGGHWWSKDKTSNNLIANSLYLATAAALANRRKDNGEYQQYAQSQMEWFMESAPYTADNTLRDGLNINNTCQPDGGVYTYNQGVMLGALVEMQKLTGNTTYLDIATDIAMGTLKTMVDENGILTEFASGPTTDAAQFKGIFARNLVTLHKARPDNAYVVFLQKNADSIWAQARDENGQIGYPWQGPYTGDNAPNAATHSSAIDCFIAAAVVSAWRR